jgi:hypothetical protein
MEKAFWRGLAGWLKDLGKRTRRSIDHPSEARTIQSSYYTATLGIPVEMKYFENVLTNILKPFFRYMLLRIHCGLQSAYVQLDHFHHGLHDATCLCIVLVAKQLGQNDRRYLPIKTKSVF